MGDLLRGDTEERLLGGDFLRGETGDLLRTGDLCLGDDPDLLGDLDRLFKGDGDEPLLKERLRGEFDSRRLGGTGEYLAGEILLDLDIDRLLTGEILFDLDLSLPFFLP